MSDTCMIKARAKNDYVYDAYVNMGVNVYIPYKDSNILLRCLREIWYRLGFPSKEIWFNKQIKSIKSTKIYVRDPLIIPEFVEWLCDLFPEKKIIVTYSNRVNRATIKPSDVARNNLEFVSYDFADCKQYGMRLTHPAYLSQYAFGREEKQTPQYDVVYLGRDKGRAEELFKIQESLENLGLRTYFHICADRSFLRFKKKYYKKEMKYTEYVNLLKITKSHLNIVPEGQKSITQREMESVFDEIKCITNNKGILDFELYDKTRFFVLGHDDLSELPTFLKTEFNPIDSSILSEYEDRCCY